MVIADHNQRCYVGSVKFSVSRCNHWPQHFWSVIRQQPHQYGLRHPGKVFLQHFCWIQRQSGRVTQVQSAVGRYAAQHRFGRAGSLFMISGAVILHRSLLFCITIPGESPRQVLLSIFSYDILFFDEIQVIFKEKQSYLYKRHILQEEKRYGSCPSWPRNGWRWCI